MNAATNVADGEGMPCVRCGHDSDHSGGECMWYHDVQTADGGSYQVGCHCDGQPWPAYDESDLDDPA